MHTRLACVALALALVAAPALVLAGGSGAGADGPDTAAATVDTADGSAISLAPANGSNGQYASYAADGELQLHLEELNEDAETTAHEVFAIDVTAAEPAALSVESDAPGVSFYWGDDPSADAGDSRTVQSGDAVDVGVHVDSYDDVDDGEFTVVAETDEEAGADNSSTSIVDADVSPTEITVGESANATATLHNDGDSRDRYTVRLAVDGTVVDRQGVWVAPGETRTVTFERTFQQVGEFTVDLGWRTAGTVTVTPGASDGGFEVSNASLSPASIEPGGTPTITADVTNHGSTTDTFTAELSVGGVVVEEQAVEVAPGETRRVSFERTFERRGRYEISISGAEAGTVQVESSTAASMRRYGSKWGWLLGAATVPTLGAAFVAARRRGRFVSDE